MRYERSDASVDTAREDLRELVCSRVDPKFLGDCIVSDLKPVDAIVELSKNYDLVVMSSHGRTGISKLMLGSVTEKVIRLSTPPVLVVKKRRPTVPYPKNSCYHGFLAKCEEFLRFLRKIG